MKYRINDSDNLIIYNDSPKTIFTMNKYNRWYKWEYDQKGRQIYRENSTGNIDNYE